MISLKILMKTATQRQMRYAYDLMNTTKTKQQAALDAGFSPSTARVPKTLERTRGFKMAQAEMMGELGNTLMKLMYEIQARDLSELKTSELTDLLKTSANAFDIFNSRLIAK